MAQELKLQAKSELLALQKTSSWKETIDLVDCFTDEDSNQYFVTQKPQMTLDQYVKSLGRSRDQLSIDSIALLISKLCKAVFKLHKKHIIHRDICQETISVRRKARKRNATGISPSKVAQTAEASTMMAGEGAGDPVSAEKIVKNAEAEK